MSFILFLPGQRESGQFGEIDKTTVSGETKYILLSKKRSVTVVILSMLSNTYNNNMSLSEAETSTSK